jgi:hypothetical protein
MALRVIAAVLAVLGAAAVAVGVWMAYPPAGVIVAGVEMVAAAYVIGYLEARRETA